MIVNVQHRRDADGRWRLDGDLSLNRELASEVLNVISSFPRLMEIQAFLLEVAYAVSALTDEEFDNVPNEDPTYSDDNVSYDDVVDFAEWRRLNYSANAAQHFTSVLEYAAPSELVHLYVRHLRRRMYE